MKKIKNVAIVCILYSLYPGIGFADTIYRVELNKDPANLPITLTLSPIEPQCLKLPDLKRNSWINHFSFTVNNSTRGVDNIDCTTEEGQTHTLFTLYFYPNVNVGQAVAVWNFNANVPDICNLSQIVHIIGYRLICDFNPSSNTIALTITPAS